MAINVPFCPSATTQSITVTGTSASITLGTAATAAMSIRLFNNGPNVVFVRFTQGASTAVVTDMPIAAYGTELFTKNTSVDTVSAISTTTGNTLYVTTGEGF